MKKLLTDWQVTLPGTAKSDPHTITHPDFILEDNSWVSAKIPGTLVGHFSEAAVYPDPYIGTNMKDLPGYKKDKTSHFAFHEMPKDSPFKKPFWYRTTFSVGDDKSRDTRYFLCFNGINFRAEIWLNQKRVASSTYIAGSYRRYKIDVTSFIKRYKDNILAVEIQAQRPDDLGLTFIDWCPVPPDDSAGIWQPVYLETTGQAVVENEFFSYGLADDYSLVEFTPSATVRNTADTPFSGRVEFTAGEVSASAEIHLAPYESLQLSKELFSDSLSIDNPRLWWPWDMGEPYLYEAAITLTDGDGVRSHQKQAAIGIRDISAEINAHGALQFSVNGHPVLIRGTAWSPDLLLRQSATQDEIDLSYVKEMNLNTVRLEGTFGSDYFWDLCDQMGLLVLAGWPCCTHWEKWQKWKPDDYTIAEESLKSQLLRLRNHPALVAWFYGSDFPPIPPVEKLYLSVLDTVYPDLVRISSAAHYESAVTGKTGVKMSGPYGYVPPVYWYDQRMPGYADSFNTETGPDSSFPRYESVCRMIPDEKQRYIGSETWNHHAGLAAFLDTEVMNTSIQKRYGVDPKDMKLFITAAQWNAYESWRAMYEAYTVSFPRGTGVIGWMQNGQWPSVMWQMYDYWNIPTGGFYGVRKACEPLHILYSYADNSIWCCNSTFKHVDALQVSVDILNTDGSVYDTYKTGITLSAYERKKITLLSVPENRDLFFLSMRMKKDAEVISRNYYWLSTSSRDACEEEGTKYTWFYRPLVEHVDYSALLNLPQTDITSELMSSSEAFTVHIENTGPAVAFCVQLDIMHNGRILAPVFWDDNMILLLPGEKRVIRAVPYDTSLLNDSHVSLSVNCINAGREA
ncbi:MAG: glycosyl hydrolase 2 galactose-binding domain-containing protein [Fibrobacterota bacterium]